jgi:hypothetical protein
MAYSPQYVSFDDIPVQIPDDYAEREKAAALQFAESSAELDLNDGDKIPQDVLDDAGVMIESAIKQKATCELAKGAEHPDDTALTDLSDTGSDKADYAAEAFCDRYDELIDKIGNSGILGEDGDGDTSPYSYSTSDPSPQNEYQDYPVDEDSFGDY